MKTAARRAFIGLLLAVTAVSPLRAQGDENAVTPSQNWWVYLENNMAYEIAGLLAGGADPNQRDARGQPSILRAVERDAWDVFDVLARDPHTNLNIENPAGETPLMYVSVTGQTARAHALIRRGARVNRLGWTPLHYAASRGQLATARLLLAAGALPNAPSPQGRTPLMMAAYAGSTELVQLLLGAGADPTTRDVNGQDAADWAARQNRQALTAELRRITDERLAQRNALRRASPQEPEPAPENVEVFPLH